MQDKKTQFIPQNGEKIWIKIFSNWSIGTYIGLDEDQVHHLAREPKECGYHLLKSNEILPYEAMPNNTHQKETFIEFTEKQITELITAVNTHWQINKYPYTRPMMQRYIRDHVSEQTS